MNIVYLNVLDEVGKRFNGAELARHYNAHGHSCVQYVWEKQGSDPSTILLGRPAVRWGLYYVPRAIEKLFSLQSYLTLTHVAFERSEHFKAADIVHYQLINNNYFNIRSLARLSAAKPSVWTLHDMWPITGHCVHAMDCERWLQGCGSCPDLHSYVPMDHDRTAFMWRAKQKLYTKTDLDMVVSSQWMMDRVKRSPLMSGQRVHKIPFGIDEKIFAPGDRTAVRNRLGIAPDHIVIGVRASTQPMKGFGLFRAALSQLKTKHPVTILTFDTKGLLDDLSHTFTINDRGWVNDTKGLSEIFQAMDIFVTPSRAESFNMTAIEAMACCVPLVTFDTTPMAGFIERDAAGVTVPYADVTALMAAMQRLVEHPEQREVLGRCGRGIVLKDFTFALHAERMMDLYTDVRARHRREHREQ